MSGIFGGGSKNQTSTTTTAPPAYLQPYLTDAASQSQGLNQGGGPKYYPGQTVTPFSADTQQALSATAQRAQDGSPVTSSAQGLATDTLNGAYLNKNPYIDATFNQAADATQGRLASQFAGSGRNISASQPARAEELNNLATQIYGGNYENERQRQQSTIPFANSLANQDYTDLGQLQTVGRNYEDLTTRQNQDSAARWDYGQNQPELSLDRYISRLSGQPGGTTSSTVPVTSNPFGSALGGGLIGSQIGGNISNSSGGNYAGLGTILGGLGGLFGS